jgi:hypothetical protein
MGMVFVSIWVEVDVSELEDHPATIGGRSGWRVGIGTCFVRRIRAWRGICGIDGENQTHDPDLAHDDDLSGRLGGWTAFECAALLLRGSAGVIVRECPSLLG